MDWVADGVAIGSRSEALDLRLVAWFGLQSALLLYESACSRDDLPYPEEVMQLIVHDARPVPTELLRQGAAFLREQRALGRTVAVACAAGISRSSAFVLAFLLEEGLDAPAALRSLIEKRRVALPHPNYSAP